MNNREEYWNNYYDYWKEKVKDMKEVPNDSIIEWLISQANIQGKVLEVGCGFGRLFQFYSKLDVKVFAIDISEKMINEARKHSYGNIIEIKKAKAEKLPYHDDFFDCIICMATFDALKQEKSLSEMLRVLKIGGKLLITGKNINYFGNDKLARNAEILAKKKGHPNSFTDVIELQTQLNEKNHKILSEYYFLKRGDFSNKNFTNKLPFRFYEYFLVVEKGSNMIDFTNFSARSSK